ncbi:MAG: FtsW/RodA/SpoVE family cell cycle protein [Lachnospiraceae bacterium]
MLKKYHLKDYRFRLVIYVVTLTIIGIFVIGSAKESVQTKQEIGMLVGIITMVIVSLIDYKFILKFSWLIYAFTIAILMIVKFFGDDAGGATRWIDFHGFRFQPSELAKILLILFFAYWFSKYEEKLNTWKILLLTIVFAAPPLLLILKQPDLSTTIVTAGIFAGMIFTAGLSYKIIGAILLVSIPGGIVFMSLVLKDGQNILEHFQYLRIMGWLQPEKFPETALQQQNSIMAIGSGQLWGKGLNNNVVASLKNGNFITEPQTDFIYAIVGEELGFVGSAVVVILLFLIAFECILIAKKASTMAGRLIATGVATLISVQGFINMSVATGLLPNTGLPLPFVSYGLTSLLSLYIGIGLVLNVGLQPEKYRTGVYR